MSVEVERLEPQELASFYREHEREALKSFYQFSVIWHERAYGFAVKGEKDTVAAGTLRVAASLGTIERLVVVPGYRRRGFGRAILDAMAEVANYYNCHKMTIMVPHLRDAQQFFEACGYSVEAILPQHTFKMDMAVLRRFLL
ncbi:MAG: GNAT family N-acetyltransferase [Candidatus Eremiobacteraeota bacterium]|nr:GNAT family N-acetyltransferase [Candidatus Eremiobacteraeota bacterium]